MKRTFFGATLACAIALVATTVYAQDDMADPAQVMPEQSIVDGYGDCCCCAPSGRINAEYQFLYLDTFGTEESFNNGIGNEDGHRVVVGYERCDGLGLRVRWFRFNGEQTVATPTAFEGLDLETIDIELTDRICICNWDGVISAGYRYAEYDAYTDDAANTPDESLHMHGLTLGVQLERELTCNLDVYLWVQQSLLYGDDDGGNDTDNTLMGWTDAQLGLQYNTCIGGYNSVIRAGVEAQRHEGGFDNDTQDTGLFGWFFSGGVTY